MMTTVVAIEGFRWKGNSIRGLKSYYDSEKNKPAKNKQSVTYIIMRIFLQNVCEFLFIHDISYPKLLAILRYLPDTFFNWLGCLSGSEIYPLNLS